MTKTSQSFLTALFLDLGASNATLTIKNFSTESSPNSIPLQVSNIHFLHEIFPNNAQIFNKN